MISIEELKQLSNSKLLEEVLKETERYIDEQIRIAILRKGYTTAYVGTRKYENFENVTTKLRGILNKLGGNKHLHNELKKRIVKAYSDEGYKIDVRSVDIGFK